MHAPLPATEMTEWGKSVANFYLTPSLSSKVVRPLCWLLLIWLALASDLPLVTLPYLLLTFFPYLSTTHWQGLQPQTLQGHIALQINDKGKCYALYAQQRLQPIKACLFAYRACFIILYCEAPEAVNKNRSHWLTPTRFKPRCLKVLWRDSLSESNYRQLLTLIKRG